MGKCERRSENRLNRLKVPLELEENDLPSTQSKTDMAHTHIHLRPCFQCPSRSQARNNRMKMIQASNWNPRDMSNTPWTQMSPHIDRRHRHLNNI